MLKFHESNYIDELCSKQGYKSDIVYIYECKTKPSNTFKFLFILRDGTEWGLYITYTIMHHNYWIKKESLQQPTFSSSSSLEVSVELHVLQFSEAVNYLGVNSEIYKSTNTSSQICSAISL